MHLRYSLRLFALVAGLLSRTALAQVTSPSQGGEVNIVSVTPTTMELSFGNSGTGQGRIVAIAATPNGMQVPLAPTDNLFYPAATTYGQGKALGKGYAVYNGTGHSVTVTGLQPSMSYYITNAEYNTDGSDIAYNTRGTSISTSTSSAATATPLPVELTAFSGTVDTHSLATLRWATASERNTAYFALEHSLDGVAFTEAGRVPAASNSNQAVAYQWTTPQPLTRLTYYRLRQADQDGTVYYSKVVTLAPTPQLARRIEVYPNPSAGRAVQLSLQNAGDETYTLRLADALGRQVLAQSLVPTNGQYLAPLALPQNLVSGTYVLTLASGNATIQKRIIVTD